MDVPGKAGAPEKAPVVLGAENGRSAALDGRVRHIAVVVAVAGGGEGSEVPVQSVAAGGHHISCILAGEGDALHVAVREAFRVVDYLLVVGLGNAPVKGGEKVVLAGDIMVELRRHVAGVGGVASVRLLVAASPQDFVGVVEVGMLPRLELVGPGLLRVDSETGHQTQELEELVFSVEIVGYGKILACVGSAYRSVVHRVHHKSEEGGYPIVCIILHLKHLLEISFFIVGGKVRIQDGVLVEVAPGGL